jgi:hypothetical protein
MTMRRIFATFIFALPLAAVCILPKSASAQPAIYDSNDHQTGIIQRDNREYNYNQQPVVIQRDNRNYNDNRQPVTIQRDNRNFDRNRDSRFGQRYDRRHHRQWVAARYERVNHRRQWVPGHYEYR